MELLNGETLAEKLQRVAKLECEEALRVMVPVCDAVAAVHARDILHRDLKPANIFLHRPPVGSTVPKVLDFGAARQIDAPTRRPAAAPSSAPCSTWRPSRRRARGTSTPRSTSGPSP
jgi:serine/threonine protein kinase